MYKNSLDLLWTPGLNMIPELNTKFGKLSLSLIKQKFHEDT
jgi:hypothetical protein